MMERMDGVRVRKYDAVILGFGKGGKTLAGELAASGKRVAVVERSARMYGGTCINVGCIPTKSLVHSAQQARIRGAQDFMQQAEVYRTAMEEKERVTGLLRKKNYEKLADLSNVDVIDGFGSFLDAHRIGVETRDSLLELEGEQIFINTGSKAAMPDIRGVEGNSKVFVSETLLDLKELPKHLVIVGGGYIGLEFASFYTSFGSKVTVLQHGPRFLPKEDADVANEIQRTFEKRGVTFLMNAKTSGILEQNDQAVVLYSQEGQERELSADAVLIAAGRKPNTEGLGLERAGIRTTSRGAVEVDDLRRASVPGVWAMGDVAGGLQFTYISLDDYRIVRSQVIDGATPYSAVQRKNVPYSVFIEPAFSRVGLSEQEAREQGYDVKVVKLASAAVPKAQVLQETEGFLKAMVDQRSGMILGAALFCAESYELINTVKLAMDAGVPASVLANQMFTHPTMSEALNELFLMA